MIKRFKHALYLRRALCLVWVSTPRWTLFSLALLIAQSILPLITLYIIKLIVDAVSQGVTTVQPGEGFGRVLGLIVLAGGVTLAADLCRSLAGFITEVQSQMVTNYVNNVLHTKSVELDLEYYENAQYYDVLHRAQADAPYRPVQILNRLSQGSQSALSLAGIALLLVSLHWLTALILFMAVLPGLFLRIRYADELYRKWVEWTPQERRADYYSLMMTSLEHAKEIRLFNLGSLFQARYRDLRHQISQDKLKLARRRSLMDLASQSSATLAVYGAWIFIAYQTLHGDLTLGSLVMYYQAFQRGQALLQETISSLAVLYENSLFLSNFYEFLDIKPTISEPLQPCPVPRPLQEGLRFDRVTFHYPNHARPVLEELSFSIQAGETVALVGENGAGKTTLIKLLCRLYDPQEGRITIDGIDMREFKTDELRQQISVIFQDYAHYNLTAMENIAFGDVSQMHQEAVIKTAAGLSGADKVIDRLPHGYDTTLGNQFEEGEDLSIGEWQKVAIARAFLRKAQIVVLDEPTSALDVESEQEVLNHFRELIKGRTAILISHRLSTVRFADRILVLESGKITEAGTHDELIQKGGTYAHMFETQAQHYR